MTGKVEQNIVSLLYRQHPAPLTIRQISERLGKAYPHVHATATRLIVQGVLLKAVVGNAYACTLNLSNEKAKASLILEEYDSTEREIRKKAVPQAALEVARRLQSSAEALGCAWWNGKLVILSRSPISVFRHILPLSLKGVVAVNPYEPGDFFFSFSSSGARHVILFGHTSFINAFSQEARQGGSK